jgi:hypothetical protein
LEGSTTGSSAARRAFFFLGQEILWAGDRAADWPQYTEMAPTYYGPLPNVPCARNIKQEGLSSYNINDQSLWLCIVTVIQTSGEPQARGFWLQHYGQGTGKIRGGQSTQQKSECLKREVFSTKIIQ